MPKFKVKAGKHVEEGVTYGKGEVITSHRDLIKAFPEKFELVGRAEDEVLDEDTDDKSNRNLRRSEPEPSEPPKKDLHPAPPKEKRKKAGGVGDPFSDD